MANKTFNNVKLNVAYTKAEAFEALNPATDKNLSNIIGKVARWYEEIGKDKGHTYTFTTGAATGTFNVAVDNGDPTPVTVNLTGVVTTVDGKISPSLLPSYVDDVIEGYYDATAKKFYTDSAKTQPIDGESGKIYIDITDGQNIGYRFISSTDGYYAIKSELPPTFSETAAGIVPASGNGGTTKFLRGDGSWQTIATTDTKNTAGSTNNTGKLYLIGAKSQDANPQTYSNSAVYVQNGTLYATAINATSITNLMDRISVMTGAKVNGDGTKSAGTKGLVPAPAAGDENAILCGDGIWYNDITFNCVADS